MLLFASSIYVPGIVATEVHSTGHEGLLDQSLDAEPPGLAQEEPVPTAPGSFFTENVGQWDVDLLFVATTDFGHVGLANDCIYYNLLPSTKNIGPEPPSRVLSQPSDFDAVLVQGGTRGHVIKVSFDGATASNVRGVEQLGHQSIQIPRGCYSSGGHAARNFQEVHYTSLYPGVDLVFRFDSGHFKYDLLVEPGGDLDEVWFTVQAAELEVRCDDLLLSTPVGDIHDTGLCAYGTDSGKPLEVSYRSRGNAFGFSVLDRPTSEGFMIDPLVYCTYIGGSDAEREAVIAVDDEGYAYVAGWTSSFDFPTTPGSYGS
jgi:hypothetical protein